MKRLEQISARMTELHEQIESLQNLQSAADESRHLQRELDELQALTQETPASLAARVRSIHQRHNEYDKAMRDLSGVICGWSYRSPRSIATGVDIPGSDSGGQHGTDACCGQV